MEFLSPAEKTGLLMQIKEGIEYAEKWYHYEFSNFANDWRIRIDANTDKKMTIKVEIHPYAPHCKMGNIEFPLKH